MKFYISHFYSGVLVFCMLMLSTRGTSQLSTEQQLANLKNITPPSPNASSLGKYGEWPVGLYTGVPNISIPIYELKGRSLSVPISLSYHAAGNKVGDIASWVGLGWSLQAGGMISRSMRGRPDEEGYFVSLQSYSDPDDLSSSAPSSITSPRLVAAAKNTADSEQDIYYLNALGKSYKLLLKSDGTVMTIPYSKIKFIQNPIVGTSTLSTDHSWTVLLEDGTKLVFGTDPYTESTNNPNFTSADGTGITFTSSWFLKSVTSPEGEVITFNYTYNSIQQDSHFSQSDFITYLTATNVVGRCSFLDQSTSVNTIVNRLTVNSLQLSSIESGICKVEFIENSSERLDLKGGKSLSEIKIYSKLSGLYIGDYKFNYSYTSASQSNSYTTGINSNDIGYYENRLRLNSLEQKILFDTSSRGQKWIFNYNQKNLPSRMSFAQDHWGFFNGATNNTSLLPPEYFNAPSNVNAAFAPPYHEAGANRNGNDSSMQAEILTSIQYPTGGSSKFFYEANSVSTTEEVFESSLKNLQLSLTGGQSNTFSQTDSFRITKAQTVLVNLDVFVSQSILNDQPGATGVAQIVKSDGTIIGAVTGSGSNFFNLPDTGTYAFKVFTTVNSSSLATSSDHTSVDGTLNYQGSLGMQTYNKPVGGLRIQHIADFDSVRATAVNDRYFQYDDPLIISPVDPVADYLSEQASRTYFWDEAECFFLKTTRNSSTKFAVGSIQGGTTGYGTVTTLYGSNAENGKKISLFSNEPDEHEEDAHIFPYPSADSRDVERGLLLQETDFNSQELILHQLINTYDFPFIKQFVGFKAGYSFLEAPVLCINQYQNCGISFSYSITTVEQVRHLTSTEKNYDQNGANPLITTTNYFYDNANNLQATRTLTINSEGDTVKRINRTPLEKSDINAATTLTSTASAAIDTMLARNIISPVLQQETYVNSVLQNRSLTNYKNWTNKILQPENVQMQIQGNPIETRLQYMRYDTASNLVEQRKTNDVIHSYIWDYGATYPIAEVINGDSASIAYSSFEADGKGGWTYSGTVNSTYSVTGNKSYQTSGGNITRSGLASATYIVSYWGRSGSVNVNSAGPTRTGKTVGDWTYYEHEVTSTSITVSGSNYIDELRLYPKDALMTTYTYTPLIGMTSQCDANNRISYYEYDAFNRLILIRDQDKNIIKKICYNYAGQPETCLQITYNSAAKSQSFTKDSCSAGFAGSAVTYTVAAGTYTSVISQADADQLAQNDVNANGQNYANLHGVCKQIVYVALKSEFGDSYEDEYTYWEEWIYYLRFYEEPSTYSNPLTLASNIDINVNTYIVTNGSGSQIPFVSQAQQGTTEYVIGYVMVAYSSPTLIETVLLQLLEGNDYIIIY